MRKIPAWGYLLPKLWASFFEAPITEGYPFEPLQLPAGFRGKVVMKADVCKGCGLCVKDCPTSALTITRFSKQQFRITYDPVCCAFCGQCEVSCHQGAIQLTNDFNASTSRYQDLLEILVERNITKEEDKESK